MPLERFSMDEKQELVDKPSSSFLTPHNNDSESVSQRICSRTEHELPTAKSALLCTLSRLVPFHQTHHSCTVPPPTSFSTYLYQSLCPGLLWGESKLEELVDFTNSCISKAILILLSPCRASWLGIEFLLHYGTQSNYCY